MLCRNCEQPKLIINKHFGLCQECNNLRLYGNKYGKQYKETFSNKKPIRAVKNSIKKKSKQSLFTSIIKKESKQTVLEKDEIFYQECFNQSNHKCEECNCDLPTIFRDEDGKIIARWRYSHIIPKSIASELRHRMININHLCLKHHTMWDFGDKKSMKIYKTNQVRFPNYLP